MTVNICLLLMGFCYVQRAAPQDYDNIPDICLPYIKNGWSTGTGQGTITNPLVTSTLSSGNQVGMSTTTAQMTASEVTDRPVGGTDGTDSTTTVSSGPGSGGGQGTVTTQPGTGPGSGTQTSESPPGGPQGSTTSFVTPSKPGTGSQTTEPLPSDIFPTVPAYPLEPGDIPPNTGRIPGIQDFPDSECGVWQGNELNWSWAAVAYINQTPRCTATLINRRWALVDADCAHSISWFKESAYVKFPISQHADIPILQAYAHPKHHDNQSYNIGLLHLSQTVTPGGSAVPLCLSTIQQDQFDPGTSCVVFSPHVDLSRKNVKNRWVQVQLSDIAECAVLEKPRYVNGLNFRSICTHGEALPCDALEGGPLACKVANNRWVMAGVFSGHVRECQLYKQVYIYQRVSRFLDWIRSQVQYIQMIYR